LKARAMQNTDLADWRRDRTDRCMLLTATKEESGELFIPKNTF
jgi:hypothetical protein